MKKMFLTMALALITMFASAQFMVVSNVTQPADGEQWAMSNFTDNIGIGYVLNDKITLGAMKNGEEMDLWGRYQMKMVYLTVQAPTDSTMTDNLNVGVGYSLSIWNNFYVEPSYSMPLKEDSEGNREGKLKIGVAYRF